MNKVFKKYVKETKSIVNNKEFPKYKTAFNKFKKIIILGNGGSNSIASHISQDMAKFYNKVSFSFSDPSMLTCFINDFGMSNAYLKFLKIYGDKNSLYILISSSGESQNMEGHGLYYKPTDFSTQPMNLELDNDTQEMMELFQ